MIWPKSNDWRILGQYLALKYFQTYLVVLVSELQNMIKKETF